MRIRKDVYGIYSKELKDTYDPSEYVKITSIRNL